MKALAIAGGWRSLKPVPKTGMFRAGCIISMRKSLGKVLISFRLQDQTQSSVAVFCSFNPARAAVCVACHVTGGRARAR
ncbi:MAG: hypothetical protein AAGK26_17015, partial [Pseudomonadota bacterium]